jgi:hypothetical protein
MRKNKMDKYIGIIELESGRYFTILKDDNGYKAGSVTSNGYFSNMEGYETIEELYNALTLKDNEDK